MRRDLLFLISTRRISAFGHLPPRHLRYFTWWNHDQTFYDSKPPDPRKFRSAALFCKENTVNNTRYLYETIFAYSGTKPGQVRPVRGLSQPGVISWFHPRPASERTKNGERIVLDLETFLTRDPVGINRWSQSEVKKRRNSIYFSS